MLTTLKDKLLTVTKNVGLFSADDGSERAVNRTNSRAGSGILQRYQDAWCELHRANEENARGAEKVARDIDSIANRVSRDRQDVVSISRILTGSSLNSNISRCLTQVKELYGSCEAIERKLVELEDILDEIDFQNMKKKHLHHLKCYRERKTESLIQFRRSLEDDHQRKRKEHDVRKKSQLEERQKVFQEAFRNDLETYKHLGTIPKLHSPKQPQNGAILEEIELDFDQRELDKFFEEENGVNGAS